MADEQAYIPPDSDVTESAPGFIPPDSDVQTVEVKPTKKEIKRAEEKEIGLAAAFLSFCHKTTHEQLVVELEAMFGKRAPTPAQIAAGVSHGKYTAAEYNKAYESLYSKRGNSEVKA
jgi:hypothetical protein